MLHKTTNKTIKSELMADFDVFIADYRTTQPGPNKKRSKTLRRDFKRLLKEYLRVADASINRKMKRKKVKKDLKRLAALPAVPMYPW